MKKNNVMAMAFIIALLVSCGDGDDGNNLPGTIQILQYGQPAVSGEVYTGTEMTADYSGSEAVAYQWKKGSANVAANVGGTAKAFTPGEPGNYTVTASASGYNSKTSKAVTVVGEAIPSLSGNVTIYKGAAVGGTAVPVTTAETGERLSAFYDGTENVAFQWFNNDTAVQDYAATVNADYTPVSSGSYTVKVSFAGYTARISDAITVTGASLITITFDLNGASGANPTRIIAPGEALTAREVLPTVPVYNGFTFKEWNTAQTETGTAVTGDTTFDESATVYARWSFSGGTPRLAADETAYRGEILLHENPLMEKGAGFAGTISEEDGAISFTAGAFNYKWPAGDDFNIGDYAYCVMEYELISATGNVSGVFLNQYGTSTRYVGVSNAMPWLSNGSSFQFPLAGAGNTGGFSIQYNGGTTKIECRITKITFYGQPSYTVTFALDGGTGTVPASVTLYEGETIGAQFPAKPAKTDYTFIGWKNTTGATITANTPIMGSWELTAQWVLTADLANFDWMEQITTTATSAPVYVFDIGNDTLSDYHNIIVTIKTDGTVSGRLRAWGVYNIDAPSRPGMQNTVGEKLLTNPGYDSFTHGVVDGWKEYVLPLNAITATSQTGATGKLAIAFGVIAPAGGSGQRIYYVKDITLANETKTKEVSATRPDEYQLWGGSGAAAFVTGNGADQVTREILPIIPGIDD